MDWLKNVAREQAMTFIFGFLLQIMFALLLVSKVIHAPDLGLWAPADWATLVGTAAFNVVAILTIAAYRAVDTQEKRVDAHLSMIPTQIKQAMDAVRAEVEARAQGMLDLRVRDERIAAADRATADAQKRLDEGVAQVRQYVEAHTTEATNIRGMYDTIKGNCEQGIIAQRDVAALVAALEHLNWKIDRNPGGITNVAPPPVPALRSPK